MRRSLTPLLAIALLLVFVPAATAHDDTGGTYLALGDSVAAGTQQPAPFTDDAYTNKLFDHLQAEYDVDEFVNLACPADDTAEMLDGNLTTPDNPAGSLCYGDVAPLDTGVDAESQLDAALAHLGQPDTDVRLITIVIGANDILACNGDPVCLGRKLSVEVPQNLSRILATLRAATDAPIVAMNYYNPNLAYSLVGQDLLVEQSQQLTATGNAVLEQVYAGFGVPVADVETAFKTFETSASEPPLNVRAICRWTRMCEKDRGEYVLSDWGPAPGPQPDIHPSDAGHALIGGTHADLIDALGLL